MARKYTRALIPALPQGPDAYDKVWADELVKQIAFALQQVRTPSLFKAGTLNISDCPKLGYGQAVGDVFSDGGTLKIVQPSDIFAPSLESLGYLGAVTTT